MKSIVNAAAITIIGLLGGRLAAELTTHKKVTFGDYVGRERLLAAAQRRPFTRQLFGCPLCVGWWARLALITALTAAAERDLSNRLLIILTAVLVGYETDRQWTSHEILSGQLEFDEEDHTKIIGRII